MPWLQTLKVYSDADFTMLAMQSLNLTLTPILPWWQSNPCGVQWPSFNLDRKATFMVYVDGHFHVITKHPAPRTPTLILPWYQSRYFVIHRHPFYQKSKATLPEYSNAYSIMIQTAIQPLLSRGTPILSWWQSNACGVQWHLFHNPPLRCTESGKATLKKYNDAHFTMITT